VQEHNRIVRQVISAPDVHAKRQLKVLQKTKRTGPGEPGPMRFEQGLLPCQFLVRCWLAGLLNHDPTKSDHDLAGLAVKQKSLLFDAFSLREPVSTSLENAT
jgi:hypothetical protein